jgi:hypothetical protein
LSANSPGHRLFVTGSYRREWFSFGATTIGLFWSTRDIGNASYRFANDMNGDGGFNDLIYVPRDASEMNFQEFTSGSRTFTVAEQQAAWDAYINQDEYLSSRRGQYAERGAVWLPRVTRADMSISQDLFTNIRGKRNSLSFRADIVNIGNLLNSDWGVGQRLVSNQPLTTGGADSEGRATYRLRVVNNELINQTFEPTAGRADVWEIGFSMRYTFN